MNKHVTRHTSHITRHTPHVVYLPQLDAVSFSPGEDVRGGDAEVAGGLQNTFVWTA